MTYRPGRCLLRHLLIQRKKTQQWLVEETGIDKYRISDYANNRGVMSLPTAKTIASALDCPIDDLYEWLIDDGSARE
ncbi:XRE family transcriptional regulator [Paenibacillus albiflavus]|uniref:XRE family transcriptional regulator n=1 Tax=Paenibacillus albiflavus TaxID=2545760 RepID=A0A4R4EDR1_9BACL|nr:helix-turn-helix transcriptional regulator [Paenibacillus albiflavus]TCZ76148.1 XRE family transcriptional regulator [Paenibacillus albiflavus]